MTVRSRNVTLASVGDINLGKARACTSTGSGCATRGRAWRRLFAGRTWPSATSSAPSRRAGAPVPKQFVFRGRPRRCAGMATFAGFDVLNLANNHVGDYGTAAMLDTISSCAGTG